MKNFYIFHKSGTPLQLEPFTADEVTRALKWQEQGSNKRSDFTVAKLQGYNFYDVETGERIEPAQGFYTVEAYQEFLAKTTGAQYDHANR